MKRNAAVARETCHIRTYNLCIVGLGNVGSALVALLQRKQKELADRYGIEWRLTGVASRRLGWLIDPMDSARETCWRVDFSERAEPGTSGVGCTPPSLDVLFEASSLNAETGEPAIAHIRTALERRAHVISANKGPVLHAYRELTAAAREGRRFFFESAMMDGAPVFSLFREALPAIELRGFRGVINSTTTVILEAMQAGQELRRGDCRGAAARRC